MSGHPNSLHRWLHAAALVALGSCFAAALPAGAQQWEPEYVDGELQPLPSGFPDRPLVIVNVDDAGSPDGIYARTFQEILNDGLSPQRVNVLDRPSTSFGTWEALQFASGEPGGDVGHAMVIHTVPATALDLLTVNLEEELGMGIDDLNVVITTEEIPYVMISRTGAPWGDSYDEMIAHAKEHPGEVRYLSREVGSAVDITMEWLFDKEGVEVEKIIGGSMQEIGIAVAAGEVDIAMVFAEVALTHDQNDRAEVLMMTGDDAIEPWLGKPVMSDVIDSKDVQWGRVIGLAVPLSTPDENREWLAELIRKATEDPRYQERGKSLPGRALRQRTHDEAAQLAKQIHDLADPIVRDLGLHHENQ
jgi:tripartite-type tricarboxylate transporter receptor subunit TctC